MGKGRKPTPRGIRALKRDRTKPPKGPAPQYGEAQHEPPAHLGAAAAELWRKLAPLLAKNDLLTAADEEALSCYCETWQQYQEVLGLLRDSGYVTPTDRGGLTSNPLFRQMRSLRDELRAFAGEFGFTPAAREKIKGSDNPPQPDEVEQFLRAV